jgi:Fe-S-cluster containining protein
MPTASAVSASVCPPVCCVVLIAGGLPAQSLALLVVLHVMMPSPDLLLQDWAKKSALRQKLYKQFLHRAKPRQVINLLPQLHDEAFSNINCLDCAACCKNYSPRFKTPDVKRISKHLGLKESVFIETYLRLDEDGDYVAKQAPCPFLGADNACTIYDQRPSDCARFPYTNEDVMVRRQPLTLKNSTFCPAVYFVLERLMEKS